MVGKYKVITLCGSTRFKEQFLEAQKRLTLEGNIIISVGFTVTKIWANTYKLEKMPKGAPEFDKLMYFSEEESYLINSLLDAFNDDMNFHNKMIDCYLRALGGLHSSTPSVLFQRNRVSIPFENKYPVVIKHRELASSQ